ncbi:hypothetical protein PR202_gb11318 [Eleusine coracana subsp. coracana]|uniref:Late embryogenesis abundant protein LEA-2 subgroup domain-containing protein n=1 Tax=Eleusine coracana subsp. coracana TaxID=191504 RepID=A0AAV5EJW1_ELECO|nr:hypothetical protein PR202_gb11318 [Eleusine coracana subsp. coracana]
MAKTTQPSAGERDPLLPSSASPPPYLDAHPADSYAVFLVPVRIRRRLRRGCSSRCLGSLLTVLFLLALAGFFLWPADPDVSVARLHLEHVSVAARPAVAVNISAALKVRVRNPDLFGLDYSRLAVDIGLPRREARKGHDAFYLLEDLARGSVPFDTVVEVEGHLRFFFLSLPVKVGG